jgi:YidC/Oxa1 family membrane protein insertase
VVLAIIAQYLQGKLSLPKTENQTSKESPANRIAHQMVLMGPILTGLVLWNLPAAVGLYWLISSIFSVGQQLIINRKIEKLGIIKSI